MPCQAQHRQALAVVQLCVSSPLLRTHADCVPRTLGDSATHTRHNLALESPQNPQRHTQTPVPHKAALTDL